MKKILPILCLFISCISFSQSQGKIISDAGFAEKIYLDVTSTIVTTDDSIWFKCLVTDADQIPTQLSKILHVEFIDFDKQVISSKLLKIEEGVTSGSFDLNEKLASGRYQLRAYTEWNNNFGEDFISKVYVDVYKPNQIKENGQAIRSVVLSETATGQMALSAKAYPRLLNTKYKGKLKIHIHTENKTDSIEVKKEKDDSYSFNYVLPKDVIKARVELKLDSVKVKNFDYKQISTYQKTIAVNQNYLDLQFFAEGGELVNGLTSNLAFKALDYNNKGKEVTGNIVDGNNTVITSFTSNTLGMGVVEFTPNSSKTYHAEILGADNIVYQYKLPSIEKEGLTIRVKEEEEFISVILKTNIADLKEVFVKTVSKGVNCGMFFMDFKEGEAHKKLYKDRYQEGILKINIFNKKGQILSERLFFNDKEENRLNLETSLTKTTYKQREKTTINITAKDKNQTPIKANVSVLVINKDLLGDSKNKQSTILSYFLLNSELKGNIENPNYYFNKENKDRKASIDALLLTQGWKNYKYETLLSNGEFEFIPEQKLTVSGKATGTISKKSLKKGIELTMFYEPLKVDTKQINDDGSFEFKIEDEFQEKFKVMFQSKNKKGKKTDVKIDLDTYETPKISYEKEEQVYLADSTYVNIIKQKEKIQEAEIVFKKAKGTIELDEVELTGYTMTPARQIMKDLHGFPDIVIENEELVEKAPEWNYGLFSVLQARFPDVANRLSEVYNELYNNASNGEVRKYAKLTYYFVDGIRVSSTLNVLSRLSIEEIKSVEFLKKPKLVRSYVEEIVTQIDLSGETEGIKLAKKMALRTSDITILSIYTYTGKGINYASRNKGIDTFFTQGFTPQTEFYTPKYESSSEFNWNIPDLRSIVHWNPNIKTDTQGNVKVEFYNGDNTGDMLIIVEGITKNGKIGYKEMGYEVKEK